MSDWGEIKTDWNNKATFVEKHSSSNKIIDYTDKINLNDAMRFDIVKSLNITIPEKNQQSFIFTTKAISLLDVINYIEQEKGKINEAIIFFYTITDKDANYTCALSERCKTKIIVSDLMNSKRQKERLITQIFDKNNVDIVFCHNHAKIAAININDDYFVLSGSMNAGNNARIEQLTINNNKEHYNFINYTFEKFKSEFQINKRY